MAEMKGFDIRHAKKMLQLIYIIAQQVPFKPNINQLSQKTLIHRNTIKNYLYFLHEARLIHLLFTPALSIAALQKPEKIFLHNTNLLFSLSEQKPLAGTVREVFLNNQLSVRHQVFILYYKRLEKGTFELPRYDSSAGSIVLDYAKLVMIIDGLSIENIRKRKRYQPNI